MKRRIILTSVLSAFALAGVAYADGDGSAGSGTLGVSANVVGSINLIFSTGTSGLTVTGTGTSAGSLPLGTVKMYGGTVPTGVTQHNNSTTSFDLSTPFNIHADLANSSSATYTLSATLTSADTVNAWVVGGVTITSLAGDPITATGAYATDTPYTLKLTVPASEAAGAISNTLNFAALAN